MKTKSHVYEEISDVSNKATSKRSRIIVFILSFVFPVGAHNFYLGYPVKGYFQAMIVVVFFSFYSSILEVVYPFTIPIYLVWSTSEGLIYLLWYKVKDGEGFRFYDEKNPPKPERNKALMLAFLLPFGLHNFYLGKIIRGIVEWGIVVIIISIQIIYQIAPVWYIPFYYILIIIAISWAEGLWLLFKKSLVK